MYCVRLVCSDSRCEDMMNLRGLEVKTPMMRNLFPYLLMGFPLWGAKGHVKSVKASTFHLPIPKAS